MANKKRLFIFSLIFCGSFSFASIESNSWSLKKGSKHPLFKSGETVSSLESKVFSENVPFDERWRLVGEVSSLKNDQDSMRFLEKCLASQKWFLQSSALKVLKKRHPSKAIRLAEKMMLNSKALVVRSEAVSVIDELGGPSDTELLWVALNQRQNFKRRQSLWIRPQIAKSILKLERSERSDKWKELLTDSSDEVKAVAQKALLIK